MKATVATAIVLAALVATAGHAKAGCLSVDDSGFIWKFVNKCSVGIGWILNNDDVCRGWKCSGYVGPGKWGAILAGSHMGNFWEWYECESPGGPYDVIALYKNGRVYCVD